MTENQKGFTLIEVLLSMLVLSIGLLTVASMQVTAIKGNSQASQITMATALIEDKLDEYKSMAYADIIDETGTINNFTWATTIAANIPTNDLKTITVSVTWAGGNRNHSLSFGTIVAK